MLRWRNWKLKYALLAEHRFIKKSITMGENVIKGNEVNYKIDDAADLETSETIKNA